MPILGAHQSIAGGLYRAVERAAQAGFVSVQLFTANNTQWKAREVTPEAAGQFQAALANCGISHPLVHDSYLINLASPDKFLWRKSVDAFADELRRTAMLAVPWVVTHPGAYTTSTERRGLRRIARALDEIHARCGDLTTGCLLETTAGQGTSLGWRFEHLAAILGMVKAPERLGVCFDTCHVFAAGYPLATPEDYENTLDSFASLIGLDRIKAFHLNDSRGELGCRVDRHAHIGRGKLGLAAFRNLLSDPRFRETPMYLETPKGEEEGVDLDVINLRTLRALAET